MQTKILCCLMLLFSMAACNNEEEKQDSPQEYIHFKGNVTCAASASWTPGDSIGIYMVKAGEKLSEEKIVGSVENYKYVTIQGDGIFVPENDANGIRFPKEGSEVDFIAYHPYSSTKYEI